MASERDAAGRGQEPADAIAAYKTLLKTFIDRRPSGTRGKLAVALGTHKSFVSQITSPAYRVPLPAQHIAKICEVCHLSPEERQAFLLAYGRAHPNQVGAAMASAGDDDAYVLEIKVPSFGDPARQRIVVATIREIAARVIALAREPDEERPVPPERPR